MLRKEGRKRVSQIKRDYEIFLNAGKVLGEKEQNLKDFGSL